jgi:hypothetical protein
MDWLRDGLNILPGTVARRRYTNEVNCTTLIYEFVKLAGNSAMLLLPSGIDAQTHLLKAGLWGAP